LKLFPSKTGGGVWRSIRSEEEFGVILAWKQRQGTRIFLRDCLDLCVALDQNLVDNCSGQYTELGAAESQAKSYPCEGTMACLVQHYIAAIRDMPFYREAKHIAAVPPRPGKRYDLPSTLASRIACALGLEDLTPRFTFKGTMEAIKIAFD
jgi:hypothetical protein